MQPNINGTQTIPTQSLMQSTTKTSILDSVLCHCDFERVSIYSFSLCLMTVRERPKHVAKLNTLGYFLLKAEKGPTKVNLQLSCVEDPLPPSGLDSGHPTTMTLDSAQSTIKCKP